MPSVWLDISEMTYFVWSGTQILDWISVFTYLLAGGLFESLSEEDVDGLFADIVRQLLSTVLRLDKEMRHVELKQLRGKWHWL